MSVMFHSFMLDQIPFVDGRVWAEITGVPDTKMFGVDVISQIDLTRGQESTFLTGESQSLMHFPFVRS